MPFDHQRPGPERAPPGEPARSRRLSICEGLLAGAHSAVTGGSLVTAYALLLGANDFHLGTLSALSAASTLGCLISAYWVGRLGRRKGLVAWGTTLNRTIWGLLGLIPFAVGGGRMAVVAFLSLTTAAGFLLQAANNAWMSWMTDLVPIERRGRYFGVRNTWLGLISQGAALGAAKAIDWFKAGGQEQKGFLVVFAGASVLALSSSWIIARQWEPASHEERPLPVLRLLQLPFRDRRFKAFLRFLLLWSAATGIAAPFWVAHMLKNLRMSYADVAMYGVISMVSGMFSQLGWGRMIDRVGSQAVLLTTQVCVATLPFLWLFATPGFLLPIWVDAFLSGLFWPGFGLAQFNLTLLLAPAQNRSAYLAAQSVIAGLAGFLTALLAGALACALSDVAWNVRWTTVCNYHLLFVMSAILRLALIPMNRALRLAPGTAACA